MGRLPQSSAPVRIGNAAVSQFQSDIYGEAMDSLYLYNKHVRPISYDFWVRFVTASIGFATIGSAPTAAFGRCVAARKTSFTQKS